MLNHSYGYAQKLKNRLHPGRIATGQVVVYCNDVHALAGQSIQVYRQRGCKSLTFTGFHFGDFTAMEHHTAHHLNVKVTHTQGSPGGFAHQSKSLRKYVIQGFAVLNTLSELVALAGKIALLQLLHFRFQVVDLIHYRKHALYIALMLGSYYQLYNLTEHRFLNYRCRRPGACCGVFVALQPSIIPSFPWSVSYGALLALFFIPISPGPIQGSSFSFPEAPAPEGPRKAPSLHRPERSTGTIRQRIQSTAQIATFGLAPRN